MNADVAQWVYIFPHFAMNGNSRQLESSRDTSAIGITGMV